MKRATPSTAALGYFGVQLSDNMEVTDEGYLLCKNAVIGRTGVQRYRFKDLPQDEARELEIDLEPNDFIELHRDAEDVFADEFVATLQGKPVTDLHPAKLLTIETHGQHDCGHMINVRRGDVPLDSGEWPLLADLMITDLPLIRKIERGLRQLSCGYTFHIARDGERILQVDMRGNHVAVVPEGRAGREACIQDAAEPQEKPRMPLTLLNIIGEFRKNKASELSEADHLELSDLHRKAAAGLDAKAKDEKTDEDREKEKAGEGKDSKGAKGKDKLEEESDIERDRRSHGKDAKDGKGGKGKDETEEEREKRERRENGGEAEDEQDPLELDAEDRPKPAAEGMDAASVAFDAVEDVLEQLRPSIAASRDSKVRAAYTGVVRDFRTAQREYGVGLDGRRRTSGVDRQKDGYRAFSAAAGARANDAAEPENMGGDLSKQMKDAYDRIRTGQSKAN